VASHFSAIKEEITMLSPVEMPISIFRVCDHKEVEDIRYRGNREKDQMLHYARGLLCKDCKQSITAWFQNPDDKPYPLALPELIGSEKQVAWANKIRTVRAHALLGVMTLAAQHGAKSGLGCWRALFAFLGQRQAKTWIDNRDERYSAEYFVLEASYFMMGSTIGVTFSPRSVYGQLKQKVPYRIDEIKQMNPESSVVESLGISA
jgi:hypothetical protein